MEVDYRTRTPASHPKTQTVDQRERDPRCDQNADLRHFTTTAAMTEGEAAATATNGQTKAEEGEAKPQEVAAKIMKQIEYYFGDYNLPRDKFLQQEIKNDDGWVTLETMIKFKRLASISSDKAVIAEAIRKASDCILEVHEEGLKIRRSPSHPLPIFDDNLKEETMKRTVYCKGFAKDGSVTLDNLLVFFKQYGPYDTVLMRHFFDREAKKQGFKGSVLVVFMNREKAQEFLELPEVKFKGTLLLRKWHEDYVEEKKKEVEERRAKKEAKRKKNEENASQENEPEGEEEAPKGTFLHFSGISEGSEVTREDLKEALGDSQDVLAWVDYSRGMAQGFFRFKEPESNKTILDKLESKLKVKDMEVTLRIVEGEEEQEQISKMRAARSKARSNSSGGRKRRGGRGGGPSFKLLQWVLMQDLKAGSWVVCDSHLLVPQHDACFSCTAILHESQSVYRRQWRREVMARLALLSSIGNTGDEEEWGGACELMNGDDGLE
ncbi:La [Chionoecetes opilio]|uniref:La n=1 Tax=Chionoecetes opilio TaxID=41210 RepID=A0A8J5D3H8_CHIOP|nr:La [Chionoecetes opilio]